MANSYLGASAGRDLRGISNGATEAIMNEDVFKEFASSSRRLEWAPSARSRRLSATPLAEGRLKGNEKLPGNATVTLGGVAFSHELKGEIELEWISAHWAGIAPIHAASASELVLRNVNTCAFEVYDIGSRQLRCGRPSLAAW